MPVLKEGRSQAGLASKDVILYLKPTSKKKGKNAYEHT